MPVLSAGNSPLIKRQAGSNSTTGVVSVYAINCLGTGPSSSVTIHAENPLFCPGLSNSQNYPSWCACCQPNGNDPGDPWNPLKTDETSARNTIYPNPNTGVFFITLTAEFESSYISVFGLSGNLLHQQQSALGENQINTTHLPDGSYILQVQGSETFLTQPLIIQK